MYLLPQGYKKLIFCSLLASGYLEAAVQTCGVFQAPEYPDDSSVPDVTWSVLTRGAASRDALTIICPPDAKGLGLKPNLSPATTTEAS